MKTVIYNIGTLAGILPSDVRRLEGSQMNQVECIENAYLVIEDGIISEFGEMEVSGIMGFQNRATPLAAGGGAHEVGGVVLESHNAADVEFICEGRLCDACLLRQSHPYRLCRMQGR